MRRTGIIAVFIILLAGKTAGAKDLGSCTDDSASSRIGSWKGIVEVDVDVNNSTSDIPGPERAGVIQRMNGYADMLHQALGEQKGFDATWYRSVGGEFYKGGPKRYQLNVPLYQYYCDDGRLDLDDESSNEVMLGVNSVWAMTSGGTGIKINGKPYLHLASPVGEIRGFPVFQPDTHNVPGGVQVTWTVLVTRPGKSPFKYASRREFLDYMLGRVDAEWQKGLKVADSTHPIRPKEVQEREKQKGLESFLQGAKDEEQKQKWTERYLNDYRTDEQAREEARAKFDKIHDRVRAHLNEIRASLSPGELEQPAMVAADTIDTDETFHFSPTQQEVCGRVLCDNVMHGKPFALVDKSYFSTTGPKSSPQFFTVSFTWTDHVVRRDGKYELENPEWEKIRDEFFARFDFDRLLKELGN